MFKKILIANRGEIAVRVIRACRDMGIATVALYSSTERDSLHVRLADECVPILSEKRYGDMKEVLEIALRTGADAVYPGYGFLAEESEFIERCDRAGIIFIGPPVEVVKQCKTKLKMMQRVESMGFRTPAHSSDSATADEVDKLQAMADEVGYPLVIKSCRGGRGRGSRVVDRPEVLGELAQAAAREAERIYGDDRLYLERAMSPSHYVVVQILGDSQGNIIHLGEREGSVLLHNQKMIEESPAPCLDDEQRTRLWETAVEISRQLNYQSAGSLEFLVDEAGEFYFTEMKARIQIEHAVSGMVSGVNIIEEQIRIAAGEPLSQIQDEVDLRGWAIHCRINAEDPWRNFMPSPGKLVNFRLPGGPGVRVDTYGYVGCNIPQRYDPLLANLTVWAEDRPAAVRRLRRALQDFKIVGVQTNLPMHQQIVAEPSFVHGKYDTNFMRRMKFGEPDLAEALRRDLAIAAAVAFAARAQLSTPVLPERVTSGWHRSSRRLPI
jgi:acetyl/propionyl-CoA carboxylase alpha subunit